MCRSPARWSARPARTRRQLVAPADRPTGRASQPAAAASGSGRLADSVRRVFGMNGVESHLPSSRATGEALAPAAPYLRDSRCAVWRESVAAAVVDGAQADRRDDDLRPRGGKSSARRPGPGPRSGRRGAAGSSRCSARPSCSSFLVAATRQRVGAPSRVLPGGNVREWLRSLRAPVRPIWMP